MREIAEKDFVAFVESFFCIDGTKKCGEHLGKTIFGALIKFVCCDPVIYVQIHGV